jgi:type I restriction enzyme M protein
MTDPDILQTILKDSSFDLSLFSAEEINALRQRIFIKAARGKDTAFVTCIVRGKDIQLKPEEIVRQLYAARLIGPCGYPKKRLAVEYQVTFGREKKSADIVVFDKDRPDAPYIVVELKKPKHKDGKEQLRSYCNATGAPMGVWTNGGQISHYHRKDPNYFEDITDIPGAGQTLQDILCERFTLRDLIIKDKIANERKSLKDIILDMEDEVLANAGVDVFEEVFKLIFTKLFDEYLSRKDKTKISFHLEQNLSDAERGDYEKLKHCLESLKDDKFRVMEFRNSGQTDTELKNKIQKLFDQAKGQWSGVFPEGSVFELSDSHLAVCVSSLQNVKLFNSNLLVVDEAFEYLVNKSSKGEKGQYFTPRHVIDMCVQMLNPQRGEHMIDTASGSCGFPVHTIFKLTGHLFTNEEIPEEDKEHVLKVFGIDFDEKTVRVARTLNLIAGDGETNVLHLNTLDYERWTDKTGDEQKNVKADAKWLKTYGKGFERLEQQRAEKGENRRFLFDLLMANPPFAGDIKETRILHQYELGFKGGGKAQAKVGRDILFIERNLDFLKPGGRMAIVLPQGRFNNTSDRHIREFISRQARILAVVGLHGNTFKPHTGTKTSVLVVQKWNDDPQAGPLCPKAEDYPIFFAVSEKGGKDNSGEYVYVRTNSGQHKLDKNGHLIVDHDLHNHGGELPDGIAEAFIEWAKKEKFSFFPDAPFDEARYEALLKGAEVKFSIVNYKEINKDFRIDAEFFDIDQLLSIERIKLCRFSLIDEISSWVTQGPNPVFSDKGIPCLTGRNINTGMVSYENSDYVNDYEYKNLSRYQLVPGDILITLKGKGSIGKVGYVTEKRLSIFSRNIGIIRPRGIDSGYLNLFLLCKYGKLLVEKGETGGTGQSTLATGYLKSIPVPRFGIENKIGEAMIEIERLRNASKESYSSAQNILLSELGLINWKPKHQLSFVRNFSEAEEAERLDAEYFHPSYDEILSAIEKTGQAFSIKELLSVCQRGKQPVYCDEGGIVVNSKHVRSGGILVDDDNRKGEVTSASILIQKHDILMNGTGVGTIGRCAPYLHDHPAIPDNHVTVLRTKKIDPVFLAIQLDSLVGQMQVAKFYKGSSGQIELYPDDIKNFIVWNAPVTIQEEIRQKVSESFTLRRQSKHLLECAKQAVEIAIEQDEQAAIEWLEKETA